MQTLEEAPASVAEQPGGQDPGSRRATARAWAALGLIVAGSVALSTLFLVGMRHSGSAPTAAPPAPAQPAAPAPATGPVTAVLSEFKVDVPAVVAPGQVTLNIRNAGTVQHELLVFKSPLSVSQYPTTADRAIDEEGAGITKISDGDNLDPGAAQTRTVDLSTPGTYVFVCNLPGHFAAGMYTTVVVK